MLEINVNDQSDFKIELNGETLILDGKNIDYDILKLSDNKYNIVKDNKSFNIEILKADDKSYKMLVNGNEYIVDIKNDLDLLLDKMGISASNVIIANDLKAPMPGLVLDIKVEVGQELKEGDPIMVLVAMKMENVLKSPADVIIKSINVEKDNNVDKNTVLVEFE